MGGSGSGRTASLTRETLDEAFRLHIAEQGINTRSVAQTEHRVEGVTIALEWTRCGFGGKRPWFKCPRCARRCAVLYRVWGRRQFECRTCTGVPYATQLMDAPNRSIRRVMNLRSQIGDEEFKPKAMHWRTFNELIERIDAARERGFIALLSRNR